MRCFRSRAYTFTAEQRMHRPAVSSSSVSRAGTMSHRYRMSTFQRTTSITATSTENCSRKWMNAAPALASGSTSRGKNTLFTNVPLSAMDEVADISAVANRFQTRSPDSRKIGKAEMLDPRRTSNTT